MGQHSSLGYSVGNLQFPIRGSAKVCNRCVEITAGILVCCMPTSTAVIKSFCSRPKSIWSTSGSGSLPYSRQKSAKQSERIGSYFELQLTTKDTPDEYIHSIDQGNPSTDQKLRNKCSGQRTDFKSKTSFPPGHIQKVTDIEVV